MKFIVHFSRIVVGILFIVSGLIKLNDPVGFSFKLEEYFSPSVLDLGFLTPLALALAIFIVIFEVMLGIVLLIGYQKKITIWSLLAMILFFTFLTFYSAYFNKVTDCGCFGDAIKLTPWESFSKDVVLLMLIVVLFFGQKFIAPLATPKILKRIVIISLIGCILYANHVLNHLPVVDFRPYKIGANIQEGMTVPPDAPKAIFEYAWTFDINGEKKTIVTNGEYPSVEGEFVGVETTEIQKGYEPPIHDFTIEQNGEDLSQSILKEENLVMVIAYDLAKSNFDVFEELKEVTDRAIVNGYKVIGMSASNAELSGRVISKFKLDFPFYFTDETTLKTIVRSNPGVLVLKRGTILQKVHYNDLDDIDFTDD
jgi:uncharacterized membrane protein YphA (DoxX/SURF4 family)